MYTASVTGNYSVTITSGACTTTKSVQITEVVVPVATITPAGPQTFCETENNQISANPGSGYLIQWYKNGSAITNATNSTYAVTSSGNYTVKLSAIGCESTSPVSVITTTPAPPAAITTSTPTSFCNGGSVTLNTPSGVGYAYQWYKNGSPVSGAMAAPYIANTAGTYTVRTSQGSCGRTSGGATVVVHPNPTVVITPAISTIQKFQTQALNATGANNYNWGAQPDLVSSGSNVGIFKPLSTTSYIIEGTDATGCKGTATAIINVIGCGDVTGITAIAYSPSRVVVQWTNPAGVTTDTLQYRKVGSNTWIRVFVTGQQYEINGLEPNANYEYNIIPLCNTTTVYVPSTTGNFQTQTFTGGVYLRVFPNPLSADGKIEIIVDKPYSLQISVVDNLGRKVMNVSNKENFAAGQVVKQVNVGALASGVYYVVVSINDKNHNIKMLVSH